MDRKVNFGEDENWTSSVPIDDENQIKKEEKFDSTGEGGEIVEKKEVDRTVIVDDKKISEEGLTPKEIEIAKQEKEKIEKNYKEEKEGIEKANVGIEEMENWIDSEDKGLLTDEGKKLLKELKGVILAIEGKTKILFDVRNEAKVFQKRIDDGEFDKGGVPQERFKNPKIDLEIREKEMNKLEMDYVYLKERMRELDEEGNLVKENEEKVEELRDEEVNDDEIKVDETLKKKGLWGKLFGGK